MTCSSNILVADVATGDDKWSPKRFSYISQIENVKQRNAWYTAHYSENDGLLDSETVRCVPRPASITNKEMMYLNTLYTVKADGRKKARTVLSWREADSDQPLYPDTYLVGPPGSRAF